MNETGRKRLRRTTFIYWMLLVYIIAALVWWFISLEKQNQQLTSAQYENTYARKNTISPAELAKALNHTNNINRRNTAKYIAEGITFLILILIGAGFVYRSARRQFKMQQQQQNFMMAVTHELKTPISVAKLNLETMQKYTLEPDKQKKLLRMTLEETERLAFLTNNILISSQLEGGGYTTTKEELDLSDLFKDCINNFRERFPERNFIDHIEPDADVKGDALLLQMLINNLLENAIKYSPKETAITALLHHQKECIQLQVMDEGMGIPDEEKKNIFTKFYRVGNESTRKTQGTGLGLYLCSIISKYHNAGIVVTNNAPRGSIFSVSFYL
ncbi:MAG TPA: ATP-binding protein [Chitinophagaceae bacterium]